MSKITHSARAALIGLAIAGLSGLAASAQDAAPAPAKPARQCLAWGSNQLTWPGSHLVSVVRGSDSICQPLDLDLRVSDGMGFAVPIRAKAITKLTPDEIKAIPKKYQP